MNDATWWHVGFRAFIGTSRIEMYWPVHGSLAEIWAALRAVNELREENGWERVIAVPTTVFDILRLRNELMECDLDPDDCNADRIAERFWDMSRRGSRSIEIGR